MQADVMPFQKCCELAQSWYKDRHEYERQRLYQAENESLAELKILLSVIIKLLVLKPSNVKLEP